jgi:hypothetical protein
MSAWLAQRAKALSATLGALVTALLANGDLFVSNVNHWWPIVSAILTAALVYRVPNQVPATSPEPAGKDA